MDGIAVIKREIEAKRGEIVSIEGEISALETDLEVLENARKGQGNLIGSSDSIPNMAYEVLRESGRPLGVNSIIARLREKGFEVKKDSLTSAIHREIKNVRLFKVLDRGIFGLLEWKPKRTESYVDYAPNEPDEKEPAEPYLEDDIPF